MCRPCSAPKHPLSPRKAGSAGARACRGKHAPNRQSNLCVSAFLLSEAPHGAAKGQVSPGPPFQEIGWRTDFADSYAVKELIGSGSFGLVYAATHRTTGQDVAVKTMPKVRGKLSRSTTLGKISKEVWLWQKTQSCCTGVVQLIDCFEDAESVHLVSELCPGGDLKRYVETHGTLDEQCLAIAAAEIFHVIKACHSVDVFFADVKPANFCIVDTAAFGAKRPLPHHLKAIDFGCSQYLTTTEGGSKRSTKRSGTLGFLAPEVFSRDYSLKAEVWSAGVTLYWLFAQRLPFWANNEVPQSPTLEIVTEAINHAPILYDYGQWPSLSAEGLDFMRRCLIRAEAQRMGVDEALSHPWLASMALGRDKALDDHASALLSLNRTAAAAAAVC